MPSNEVITNRRRSPSSRFHIAGLLESTPPGSVMALAGVSDARGTDVATRVLPMRFEPGMTLGRNRNTRAATMAETRMVTAMDYGHADDFVSLHRAHRAILCTMSPVVTDGRRSSPQASELVLRNLRSRDPFPSVFFRDGADNGGR